MVIPIPNDKLINLKPLKYTFTKYEIAYFQERLMTGLPSFLNIPSNISTVTVTDNGIINADFMFEKPTRK